MSSVIWAAIVIGVAYLLLLVVHPVHRCPACRGRKSVLYGTGRAPCTSCACTGRSYRPGAVMMHRLLREHAWPLIRDRISGWLASRTGGGQ